MEQTILLFEDEGFQSLLPLTYTRTAADIRCGVYTLRERLRRLYGQEPQALTRSYLAEVFGSGRWPLQVLASNRPVLLINSRLIDCGCLAQIVDAPIGTILLSDDNNTARSGGTLVAARLSPSLASAIFAYLLEQNAQFAIEELTRFGTVIRQRPRMLNFPFAMCAFSVCVHMRAHRHKRMNAMCNVRILCVCAHASTST